MSEKWIWDSCSYPSDTLVKYDGNKNKNFEMSAALSNYEYSAGKDFFMKTYVNGTLTLSQNISYRGNSSLLQYRTIPEWYDNVTKSTGQAWDYVKLQLSGSLDFKNSSDGTIQSLFNDRCEIPGACGAFGICSLKGCECPQGFKQSNQTSDFTCEGPGKTCDDHFVNVTGRTYLDPGSFSGANDATAENCLSQCRNSNCACMNALHLIRDDSKKTGPCLLNLTSVLTIRNVSDQNQTQTLFLRVPSVPVPIPVPAPAPATATAPTSSTKSSRRKAAIWFAGGAGAFLFLLLHGSAWWLFLKRRKLDDDDVDTGKPAPPSEPAKLPRQYSYKELEESTGKFNRRLGHGGSSVYAGQSKTAIKRLDDNIEEKAFLAAVATMASLSHLNLVPLRGFCSEGRHKMLVYELVDDGQSLDCYLFRKDSSLLMHVQQRRMIALETARGLAYLHASHIIHGGVKPENIMIDSDENIRLVDYGLMSLTPNSHKLTTATERGSRVYMAPEWSKPVPVTVTSKADVYSFGVVLLELVSGRSCWTQSGVSEEKRFLPSWASAVLARGPDHLLEIADPRLDAQALSDDDKLVLRGMIFVALWCVQEDPSNRYPMSHVVGMLNGDIVVNRPPSPGLDALATQLYTIHGNNEPRTDSPR